MDFKVRDARTLSDGAWLNDEVVNQMMGLLQHQANKSKKDYYFFSSFFFSKLNGLNEKCKESQGVYNYSNVRRWTKRIDVSKMKSLWFPINLTRSHWLLGVAHMVDMTIKIYDSYKGIQTRMHVLLQISVNFLTLYLRQLQIVVRPWIHQALLRFLEDEFKDKNLGVHFNRDEWTASYATVPQQANGNDCGVFTCWNAYLLANGLSTDFCQQVHIPMLRRRLALALMEKTLP